MVELFNVHSFPVGLAKFVAGGWRLVARHQALYTIVLLKTSDAW